MKFMGKLDKIDAIGFILVLLIVYSIVKEIPILTSLLISCSFIFTILLYVWKLINNKIDNSLNILMLFNVLIVFINITLSGFGGFDYYKKAIMYVCTLLLLVYNCNARVSRKTVYCLIFTNVIIGILYLVSYKQGFDVYQGEYLLTLNFTNPNQAGMYVFTTLLYLILSIESIVGSYKKFMVLIALALLIPLSLFLYNILTFTGCRSAIMAVYLFIILSVYDYIRGGKKWMKKWMITLISVLPFIFVFIYIMFASSVTIDVSFGIENAGKSVMTRQSIWAPIVNDFFHYFLFGDYYGISNGTGVSQMHNTHLDVYASYGIIALIIYIMLLRHVLWKTYVNTSSRYQRLAFYAFIASMVIGTFEASYVAGSGGLFILTNGYILLANSNINEGLTGKLCISKRQYR